jgi:hypothetical protein
MPRSAGHFLYRVTSGRQTGPVVVPSLDSAERTVLRDSDSTNVAYSAGHLLFLSGRTPMAQPFDPDRLTLSGTPFPIADDIQTLGSPYYGFFAASPGGVLTYRTSVATGAVQLTWIDRAGKTLATIGAPANYGDLALSRDGKKAAVTLFGDQEDIWLIDLERDGLSTRFTFDDANEITPIWSPEGSRLAFGSLLRGLFIPGLTRRQAVPLQSGTHACSGTGAHDRRGQLGRGTKQVVWGSLISPRRIPDW